jgi:cell division protein FtsZ
VILGLGYDNALDRKIGITLIATGFEHKSPFGSKEERKPEVKKEEKILMTLQVPSAENLATKQPVSRPIVPPEPEPLKYKPQEEPLMPRLVQTEPLVSGAPMILFDEEVEEMKSVEKKVEKKDEIERYELVYSHSSEVKPQPSTLSANPVSPTSENKPGQPASKEKKEPAPKKDNLIPDINHSPATAVSGGYLAKPSNIYAEQGPEQKPVQSPPVPVNDIIDRPAQLSVQLEEEPSFDMQLVLKDEPSTAADQVKDEQTQIENATPSIEDLPMVDEVEEQKRRASERVQK